MLEAGPFPSATPPPSPVGILEQVYASLHDKEMIDRTLDADSSEDTPVDVVKLATVFVLRILCVETGVTMEGDDGEGL